MRQESDRGQGKEPTVAGPRRKSGATFQSKGREGRLFAAQVGEIAPLVDRQGAGENRVMM